MKPENLKLLQEADQTIKLTYAVIILLGFIDMVVVLNGGTPKFNLELSNVSFFIVMISVVHSKILKILKSESTK